MGELAGTSGCTLFAWSPDSTQVAFPVDSGTERVGNDFRVAVDQVATQRKRVVGTSRPCKFGFDRTNRLVWDAGGERAPNGGWIVRLLREGDAQPLAQITVAQAASGS